MVRERLQGIRHRVLYRTGNQGQDPRSVLLGQLDSLIMKAADETAVPAGGALAVDRDKFSAVVTKTLKDLPNVHVHEEEITEIPKDGITIVFQVPSRSVCL